MIRKNKKRIDPRYFLHETAMMDLNEVYGDGPFKVYQIETKGDEPTLVPGADKNRSTLKDAKHAAEQQRGRYEVYILDKDGKRVYTKKTGAK